MPPSSERQRPHVQVRRALTTAKLAGMPWEDAWPRATRGEVCDSYRSARNDNGDAWPEPPEGEQPPNLDAATDRDGAPRCAGCRYAAHDRGGEPACALYETFVFHGVLWPHRTDDRHEWQYAIASSEAEWRAAYLNVATPEGADIEMLRPGATGEAVNVPGVVGGTLAA